MRSDCARIPSFCVRHYTCCLIDHYLYKIPFYRKRLNSNIDPNIEVRIWNIYASAIYVFRVQNETNAVLYLFFDKADLSGVFA